MRIAGIEHNSTVDGEGWRTTIFFQGCSHHCKGCHNPQTWDFNGGNEMTLSQLMDIIEDDRKDNPLIDGVTLSGGDPFFQAKEVEKLCKELKERDYNIWAYTGFEFERFIEYKQNPSKCTDEKVTRDMLELLNYVDVVVDGKFIQELKTLDTAFVGSSNQRIIDVQSSMQSLKIVEHEIEEM
jgi:anaerobic ribonucleoside-triphosphate reductase activating protein